MIIILEKYINILTNCSLFKGIKPDELLKILTCMRPKITKYKARDIIVAVGSKPNVISIILDGTIEVSKENISGNKTIINKFYTGAVFGEIAALSDVSDVYVTITTLSPSIILSLQIDIIKNMCQNCCPAHNLLISNVITELANKAMFLNSKIQYLSIKSIRGKLCTFLYNTYVRHGKLKFNIQYNRNELADFLNISRPSMCRELGRLRDEKILSFKRCNFELLDIEQVANFIE